MKRNKYRLPVPQHEFGFTPDTISLIAETGLDGERITRERGEADHARHLAESAQHGFRFNLDTPDMLREAVVLILTDEHQRETIFGFFKFPAEITDIHGKPIAETGLKNRWISRDFVNSPDPRFRKIIRRFADAGFLESERDEFDSAE
jgi:hypothetical protein